MTRTEDSVLRDARARIDELDTRLVALVNERLEVVAALVRHKRANGIPLRDPGREEQLARLLAEANAGPLSAEGVLRLCAFVLELTRDEVIE